MRTRSLTAAGLLVAVAGSSADAQRERDERRERWPAMVLAGSDHPRSVLGISVGSSASLRDTLGVLVTHVTPNGPAERAGIEEGNRLQSINNVSLRVATADAEDHAMSRLMSRRLTRELDRVRPGEEVELRVYGGGRARTVRVRTADPDSLYASRSRVRIHDRDRASIGVSLGATGSRRDTLGVLVIGVNDSGPAARAGIIEGHRIAEINGVDLRVSRDDVGDDWAGNTRVQRLTRELRRLEPGNEVTLRVWQDGQYRTIRLRTVRSSDLPRRRGGFFISGDDIGPITPFAPLAPMPPLPPLEDLRHIGPDVRHHIERALEDARREVGSYWRGQRT